MTSGTTLTIATGTGTSHLRSLSARVAKARFSGNLHDSPAKESAGGNRFRAQLRQSPPSHSGTRETAPLWYGPRLRPAFVAQVIGQILYPENRDPRPALAAYDERAARASSRAVLNRSI